MISIIDTHAHLDLPAFDADRPAILARARAVGVHAILLIGFNPERWRSTADLCERYPCMLRTAGLHPNDAERWTPSVAAALEREIATGTPIAVGEIGLDFYRDHADPGIQREAFAAQLSIARDCGLPVVIHQRAAEDDVLAALERHAPVRGVMHCFSGNAVFAARCVDMGLHLGVGGVVTYSKSSAVREALAVAPLDRLVLETDAPYLAPQAWRGKRNEPAYLTASLAVLAEVRSLSLADIATHTSANAASLFGEAVERARRSGVETARCA